MPVGSTVRVRSSRSQTEVGKAGEAVRAATQRPAVLSIRLANGQVVDARVAPGHETVGRELPVLVAIRSVPLPAVIVPLVGEADRDPVLVERPQLLDQPIVQLPVPFPREELDDRVAPLDELRAIAPHAVPPVGLRDLERIPRVPAVLCEAHLLMAAARSNGGRGGRAVSSRVGVRVVVVMALLLLADGL